MFEGKTREKKSQQAVKPQMQQNRLINVCSRRTSKRSRSVIPVSETEFRVNKSWQCRLVKKTRTGQESIYESLVDTI